MATERRSVCHRCAQIKQACDGNIPCSRCTRLSLPCRSRNSPDTANAQFNIPDSSVQIPKARIRRVQTGCLMCKQRKKKCDEVKPKCGDCRRLCLECQWPPERAKEGARGNKAATVRQQQQHIQQQKQHQHHQLPQQQEQPQPQNQIIKVTSSPIQATALPQAVSTQQITIRSHSPMMSSPRSRAGSLAASDASRIISHDGKTPIEGLFWDESIHMSSPSLSWYEIAKYESLTPVSHSSPESVDCPSLSVYIPQLLPHLKSSHDRALLNHYSTIVSPLLSRRSSTATNPYLNYLLPLAHSNEMVLHCILALSGNHWRKMQPSMGNRGFIHQSEATQALARLLPSVDKQSADIALVSSLLLCMTELFDGTSEGWKLHLKGAKKLLAALRQQHGGDLGSGHYKFLLRLSRFLDSAATVSTCRAPLMEEEAREAAAIEGLTANPEEDDSAIYGIPKELFHLVDKVNSLADKRKDRVDAASEAIFREEAALVEELLNHWSYEYGGIAGAVSTLAPSDEDAVHATMAFEHALRLRLHQIVEGYNLDDAKVVHAVEGILEVVQKIRYGSPLESCLLFPLVMAGGACWRLEQRVIIQDRLMVMERTCGFGYVYNARALVERVWTRRDQTNGTGAIVNWARIRYEEMGGLVVF